jgi:tetratricopeptide (TPR) repeat protein
MRHLEQEAQELRDKGEFDRALQICDAVLLQHPKSPDFIALRREIIVRRRQAVVELIRQVGIGLHSEPQFEKRFELLGKAMNRFPNEPFFRQSYDKAKQSLDEVHALASRAHRTADEGQFEEALSILDTISGIYPGYPPLIEERERITILQEKARVTRRKARRLVGIRMALAQGSIEGTSRELQRAFEEFPNDDELVQLQNELIQLENKTKEASDLYENGRHQVAVEEFEAGIAMLRQAYKLNSKSRRIEMALFDGLVQFAKNIVDVEPKRAKHLLEEATRVSPFNLTIENAAKYLSDRIRECALNDCRMRVHVLRDKGQIHEALKLVTAVANEHSLHDDPDLEQLRSDIWVNFRSQSGNNQEAENSNKESEPKLENRLEERIEPAPVPAVFLAETSPNAHAIIAHAVEARRLLASLRNWAQSEWTAMEAWKILERSRRALQRAATEGQAICARAHEWRDFSSNAFARLPKSYKTGTGVVCLLLIVATTLVSSSLRRPPELTSVGTAIMLSQVMLQREPSVAGRATGNLKIGQAVEILSQLPVMTPDAWVLIRSVGDKQTYGYARLQNLDRIQTGNPQFDLWHAMSLLDRSSSPGELETRLSNVDTMLQTESLSPSRDADAMLLRLSKAFANLAIQRHDNPESARTALVKADAYLSRVAGALQLSDEAIEVKESIHMTRITLGDATSDPVPIPPATQARDEEARIMRLANNAYAQGTYEQAVEYSSQVLKTNNSNLEARKLLDAARHAQKDLEEAITGR